MRRLEAVTFDALGTLVALEPPGPLLRRGMEEHAGVGISSAEADVALAAEISYYRAHLDEGRDRESLTRLRRRCTERLRDALPPSTQGIDIDSLQAILLNALRFSAFADARAAIEAVRRLPARVLVVSNWDVSLEEVLLRLRLAPLLDGVITSASAGARKPSEAIFARALESVGVAPERAVHVGDSVEEDVWGARRAGIEPILLSRDGRTGPPGVRMISGLGELPAELWRFSSTAVN